MSVTQDMVNRYGLAILVFLSFCLSGYNSYSLDKNFNIWAIASSHGTGAEKPRVIVSSDIGGTDPDDFQSMIHYLMYADRFDTEGLISSPYGPGRKEDILDIIGLYEKDYPKLKAHADFPVAGKLKVLVKQGAVEAAPAKGWSLPTEGSEWIIRQARKDDPRPLWVLVWGGLEDLAQALHDAPDIASRLRVYWIGGPNKKWSLNAYAYIAQHFPALWMIEANSTYRGWFAEPEPAQDIPERASENRERAPGNSEQAPGNKAFFEKHIRGVGELGKDFGNYYEGEIKMGDSPSLAYLLQGDPDDPRAPGWGGSFVKLPYSARRVFDRNTTLSDTLPVYGIIEWHFKGPEAGLKKGMPCLKIEIDGQYFDGYYLGDGQYLARFVPKKAGRWTYRISSEVKGFGHREGAFVSSDSWPGPAHKDNISGLAGWWSDNPDPRLFAGGWQGAQSVARWRKAWMNDWAKRWRWLR